MATLSWSLVACRSALGHSRAAAAAYSRCFTAKVFSPSLSRPSSRTLITLGGKVSMAEHHSFPTDTLKCEALGTPAAHGSLAAKLPVVSADWLHQRLGQSDIKVLDASWYMPAEQRNPLHEFTNCHIPGALFFDIDGIVDDSVDLPHMLPSEAAFAAAMSALGLKNTDTVVVYDGKGIFSAARAWWMFRVFGHEKVHVLNGGLPHWRALGYPLDSSASEEALSRIRASVEAVKNPGQQLQADFGNFNTSFHCNLVWSLEQVRKNIEEGAFQHIDARSKARFDGVVAEPRKGIRSGHVPGSKCIPFTEVLDDKGMLLPSNDLQTKFKNAGLSLDVPIISSCGTGVTACILALALNQLGIPDVPVYDGSWTEWGGQVDTPVVTNVPSSSCSS